jgi:hypothetical protein
VEKKIINNQNGGKLNKENLERIKSTKTSKKRYIIFREVPSKKRCFEHR